MLNTKEEVTNFMFKLGYFKEGSKSLENADYFIHRTKDITPFGIENVIIWDYTISVEENLHKIFKQLWIIAQALRDFQILHELEYKEL